MNKLKTNGTHNPQKFGEKFTEKFTENISINYKKQEYHDI